MLVVRFRYVTEERVVEFIVLDFVAGYCFGQVNG